jgi:hypothetical protein
LRDREDAVAVGRAAVCALLEGRSDVMASLDPIADTDEPTRTSFVDLMHASGSERVLPTNWLKDGAIPVTNDFLQYLRPLAGPIDEHFTEPGPVVRL